VRVVFSILISLLLLTEASGQIDTSKQKNDTLPDRVYLLQQVKRDGVTMPEIQIKEVTVLGKSSDKTRRVWARRYDRLVYNLKTVYPYALIVRQRLIEVNEDLSRMTTDRERRRYIKDVEKNVLGEYEDDARNMTITQGRLLIKLIDRETQNTSYELIRLYRGSLNAAFWQGIARIFGTNLKEQYDPYGDDIVIELIIQDIEAGRL
jgi:hypothetical protein